ncbi:MAG: TCP-1/cpn60 chaperonin family protein [Pirellulaceae bacterium]
MVREVASKTSDVASDGTTTATVMAEAIFNEGLKTVTSGCEPGAAQERHGEGVRGHHRSVGQDGHQDQEHRRTQQCRDDRRATTTEEIGDLLANAMEKVGKDGVITVDEGKSLKTEIEWVEGMFDRGYQRAFVTDASLMHAVLEDPFILVFEKKISNIKDLVPVLEQVVQQNKPLLIIAEDVDGEALKRWSSTVCVARSTAVPSRLRVTVIAARR